MHCEGQLATCRLLQTVEAGKYEDIATTVSTQWYVAVCEVVCHYV